VPAGMSRKTRSLAVGLVALSGALVTATVAGGAERPWEPPPCTRQVAPSTTSAGTWWRLDPRLRAGWLVGQRLTLGSGRDGRRTFVDLPAEAFAAGPFGGVVLVGSDDGDHSVLSLIDVPGGCATPIGASDDVIRRATLDTDGGTVLEFRVDRATRTDLGLFRRPLAADGSPERLLGPLDPDARFGPTWTTELQWSTDGRTLAMQSCGAVSCRTRIVDPAAGMVSQTVDPAHGDIVGLTEERLVVHGACGGTPCPLISVDLRDGSRTTLAEAAGQAVIATGPSDRSVVVYEQVDGARLRSIDVDGVPVGEVDRLIPNGLGLVPGAGRAGSAAELDPGVVVLGPGGRMPLEGPLTPVLWRLSDGALLPFEEVLP
jgi:hypothetical protein